MYRDTGYRGFYVSESHYKDNELDGLSVFWKENGEKIAELMYSEGRVAGKEKAGDTPSNKVLGGKK